MLNDLKSEFSLAYVRAVAHAAGYFVQDASRLMDSDGVDLTVFRRGNGGTVSSPRLDLQVKATASDLIGDPFKYNLTLKNYNELRSTNYQVPRILVVVSVPEDPNDWVEADESRLLVRRCGYWKSLHGASASGNLTQEAVYISRSSPFHVAQLKEIMERIGAGELP